MGGAGAVRSLGLASLLTQPIGGGAAEVYPYIHARACKCCHMHVHMHHVHICLHLHIYIYCTM